MFSELLYKVVSWLNLSHKYHFLKHVNNFLKILLIDVQLLLAVLKKSHIFLHNFIVVIFEWKVLITLIYMLFLF